MEEKEKNPAILIEKFIKEYAKKIKP